MGIFSKKKKEPDKADGISIFQSQFYQKRELVAREILEHVCLTEEWIRPEAACGSLRVVAKDNPSVSAELAKWNGIIQCSCCGENLFVDHTILMKLELEDGIKISVPQIVTEEALIFDLVLPKYDPYVPGCRTRQSRILFCCINREHCVNRINANKELELRLQAKYEESRRQKESIMMQEFMDKVTPYKPSKPVVNYPDDGNYD